MHKNRSHVTKRSLSILAVISLLAGLVLSFYVYNHAQARTASTPTAAANIIGDTTFRAGEDFLEADIQQFLDKQPGPLKSYRETIYDGVRQSAARSLALTGLTAGVSPKVLLALLEVKSHLLSDANSPQSAIDFALGFDKLDHKGFSQQLKTAAELLSQRWSNYDVKTALNFKDGSSFPASPLVNRGTYAVEAILAATADPTAWQIQAGLGGGSFYQVYKSYFGDPLAPAGSSQGAPEAPATPTPAPTQPTNPQPANTGTLAAYLNLLNDRDSLVRQSAINGLGKLGSKEAIPPLLGLLSDPDKAVRDSAAKALLALGAKEQTMSAWVGLLSDRNEEIRQGAAAGLRELGDLQTISNLNPILTNPDPAVRQVAGEVRTYLKIKLLALNVALGSHD
ncbi:MAG: HEAT repeat domain-containing protein [Chloroflexi bacterium]|nr:HEAT repeat domain-containing protein [Chloroflexota bacterium]OJW00711.1 MAG: hypothetical protein BGO39_19890 [Chloroflexi bacterium 54-19]